MRSLLIGCSVFLLISTALFAQNRSGFVNTPGVTRSFGSVVFPGGSSALPGVQRTTGSVVNPGGGGPQIGVPAVPQQGLGFTNFTIHTGRPGIGAFGQGQLGHGNRGGHRQNGNGFAVPVFVGGGYYGGDAYSYDNGYGQPYDNGYAQVPPQAQVQQQPQILVIYPPSASATPMSIYPSEPGGPQAAPPSSRLYPTPPSQPAESTADSDEATHYLIAFKDHTIYSAVAYWVDGDTLHYFTSGNTHNQVSLSLVDRPLTAKLNKDSGLEVKLPPAN